MAQANIILTGFMGTGKSTIGRTLAARLGLGFIDTDQLIEQRNDCKVADIFDRQGEPAFRQMEAELAQELAGKNNLVIATGGGFFINPENIRVLRANSHIVCLTATPQDILNRIKEQEQTRPLLQHPDPLERINQLLRERDPVYRQFLQISTSGQTIDQIVGKLINLLRPES